MRVTLIDTDILIYRAACTTEDAIDWGDDVTSVTADLKAAKQKFKSLLAKILEETKADRFVLAISDSLNWRKDVLESYKANRANIRKPVLLRALREWCFETYPKECQMIPRLEGDDVMGIRATCGKKHTYIMASIDKDMKTVPGTHYNFDKGTTFKVTPSEAEMYHMTQTLTGDATDGYKGCPGIGPTKAKKILERECDKTLWEKVVEAFEKADLTEADALVQARMAYILQHDFFNPETQEPILWTPPATT